MIIIKIMFLVWEQSDKWEENGTPEYILNPMNIACKTILLSHIE